MPREALAAIGAGLASAMVFFAGIAFAAPLTILFIVGIAYVSLPARFGFDEPQLVQIKHLS